MEIGFAIGKTSGGEFNPNFTLVSIVRTYDDIRKAEQTGLVGHTRSFFNFIQALSRNPAFTKEILGIRKELKLPTSGLPFNKYLSFNDFVSKNIKSNIPIIQRFLGKNKLRNSFAYPPELDKCLYDIVFYGIVSPFSAVQSSIAWNPSISSPVECIELSIFAPVTKHALHKFIDRNWKDISSSMRRLEQKPTADFSQISPRDFEIVDLRDQKKFTFSKIAEVLSDKYGEDDVDATINRDSVKTAYTRTKKKIIDIFKSK
ncbi:MAG: hypothetical protein PHV33_05405 [Elusimicrobiales bacterium]|nr:hypothetical protein [Elusimicrobiales bacterium]